MLLSSNWKQYETYRPTNRDLNIDTKWYVCSNQKTLNFKVTMGVQTRSYLFENAIRHMNLNLRFSPIRMQSARFRSFELRQHWLPKWILHFKLKYASCKNDSYLLAVTEVSVIRRKVNFFLYNAIRRLRVVRQTQNFRKSNEAQQRLIVGNFHEDWFNATPWNFRTNLAQQPGRNPRFNIRCFDVLLIFRNWCGPSIPPWLVHFSVNMVKLYSRSFRGFKFSN